MQYKSVLKRHITYYLENRLTAFETLALGEKIWEMFNEFVDFYWMNLANTLKERGSDKNWFSRNNNKTGLREQKDWRPMLGEPLANNSKHGK